MDLGSHRITLEIKPTLRFERLKSNQCVYVLDRRMICHMTCRIDISAVEKLVPQSDKFRKVTLISKIILSTHTFILIVWLYECFFLGCTLQPGVTRK